MPPKKVGRPRKSSSAAQETTSASTRPRRETAPATPTPANTTDASKKRGRPRKEAATEDEPPAKRGRPAASKDSAPKTATAAKAPGQRGRPRKDATAETKKPAASTKKAASTTGAKKRGRPAGVKKAPAVPLKETGPPKKRGRPPKGGETTKVESDDAAAADQLEDELNETADEPVADGDVDVEAEKEQGEDPEEQEVHESKRRASAKNKNASKNPIARSRGGVKAQPVLDDTLSGKHFWLMKAEQVDRQETTKSGKTFNTKFTIDDLLAKGGPEAWDGVRNPLAAKNMRMMKNGDLAFFYASGGDRHSEPGIVGIMEIVREFEPDVTTSDQDHYAYVEKEVDRGRWCVVHVEFRKKFSKPVTLKTLKEEYSRQSSVLSNMELVRMGRLSVAKVTEQEWDYITQHLVDGFETEIDSFGATKDPSSRAGPSQQTATGLSEHSEEVLSNEASETLNDTQAAAATASAEQSSKIHHSVHVEAAERPQEDVDVTD